MKKIPKNATAKECRKEIAILVNKIAAFEVERLVWTLKLREILEE